MEDAGAKILDYYSREVENSVDDWLEFTHTEENRRRQILKLIHSELEGGAETGMRPFFTENKLMFLHTWGIVVGQKR